MYPPYQIPIPPWWWTFLCDSVARIMWLKLKFDSGNNLPLSCGEIEIRLSAPQLLVLPRSWAWGEVWWYRFPLATDIHQQQCLCLLLQLSVHRSFTRYCCDHQKIKISHFCRESLDLAKKLPSLMDFEVLHLWHRHLNPSEISFCCLSTMATPHLHV